MSELGPQQIAGIIILLLSIGAVIGGAIYHFTNGGGKCKHEWEKVIDDSIHLGGGNVLGHQVVFFCKNCGKYKAKRVSYDKIRKT